MANSIITHCPDCGKELHKEVQIWKHKPEPTITLTCNTTGCTLKGTTLRADEWVSKDLNAYRQINLAKA